MNSFVWQGKDSYIDYGVVINVLPPETVPEEDTEEIEIKGRDGNLTIDFNTKKSYTLPMECTLLDFTKIDEVKTWLSGSGDLTFNWSNYKYNARLNNKIDISQSLETFGEFPLIWKVQPHKLSTANALITLIDFTNSNLVANGGFENGSAGWALGNQHSISTTKKLSGLSSLKMLVEGLETTQNIACNTGDKLYVSGSCHIVSGATPISPYISISDLSTRINTSAIAFDYTKLNQWQSMSTIKTCGVAGVTMYVGKYNAGGACEIYFDNIVVINLTKTFGTGNEPVKAWCDANIAPICLERYITSLIYIHNELNYNPITWVEWTKTSGAVADSSGVTLIGIGSQIAIPTNLKVSTKYGMLMNIVGTNTTHFFIYGGAEGHPFAQVNFYPTIGNVKLIATTLSTFTANEVVMFLYDGGSIKFKDIRIFELPTGSQIETDFNTLTADQLSTKYPFGEATSGVIFNPSTANAKPTIKVYGTGTINLTINSTAITLTNVADYVTIDSVLMDAYKGTILKNNDMVGEFFELLPGNNIINWAGNVSKIEVTPNWRYL